MSRLTAARATGRRMTRRPRVPQADGRPAADRRRTTSATLLQGQGGPDPPPVADGGPGPRDRPDDRARGVLRRHPPADVGPARGGRCRCRCWSSRTTSRLRPNGRRAGRGRPVRRRGDRRRPPDAGPPGPNERPLRPDRRRPVLPDGAPGRSGDAAERSPAARMRSTDRSVAIAPAPTERRRGHMLDPRPPRLPVQPPSIAPPPRCRRATRRPSPRRGPAHPRGARLPRPRRRQPRRPTPLPRSGWRASSGCSRGPSARDARRSSPTGSSAGPRSGRRPARTAPAAEALAAWLDATADRPRAERAAAGPAPVSIVEQAVGTAGPHPAGTPRASCPARTP